MLCIRSVRFHTRQRGLDWTGLTIFGQSLTAMMIFSGYALDNYYKATIGVNKPCKPNARATTVGWR